MSIILHQPYDVILGLLPLSFESFAIHVFLVFDELTWFLMSWKEVYIQISKIQKHEVSQIMTIVWCKKL